MINKSVISIYSLGPESQRNYEPFEPVNMRTLLYAKINQLTKFQQYMSQSTSWCRSFSSLLWICTSQTFFIKLNYINQIKSNPFASRTQLLQFVDSWSRSSYETRAWHCVESHSSCCVMGPSQNIWKCFIRSNT